MNNDVTVCTGKIACAPVADEATVFGNLSDINCALTECMGLLGDIYRSFWSEEGVPQTTIEANDFGTLTGLTLEKAQAIRGTLISMTNRLGINRL